MMLDASLIFFHMHNSCKSLNLGFFVIQRKQQDPYYSRSTSSGTASNLKPMVALPSVNYCTPDVVWYQTNNLVKFDIMLPGVEKYFLNILRKSIFSFR